MTIADNSPLLKDPAFGRTGVDCRVLIEYEAWDRVDGLEALILEAAKAATTVPFKSPAKFRLSEAGMSGQDLAFTVVLSGDAEVQALNATHRQIDKPTNVLSFPAAQTAGVEPSTSGYYLGDVILAFETVAREAEEQQIAIQDHVCHLVIHGILHLAGYDHVLVQDADEMEQLETKLLAKFGIANPYAG